MTHENFRRCSHEGAPLFLIPENKTVRVVLHQTVQYADHTKRCGTSELYLTRGNHLCHAPCMNIRQNGIHQGIPILFIIAGFCESMVYTLNLMVLYIHSLACMQVKGLPIFYDIVMGESHHFMAHVAPFFIFHSRKERTSIKYIRILFSINIIFHHRQTFSTHYYTITLTVHPKDPFLTLEV